MPHLGKRKPTSSVSFVVRKGAGTSMVIVARDRIEGDERVLFDLKAQQIAQRGARIIDKSLTVDDASDPPVHGWILYREMTSGERKRVRPIFAPVKDQGAGLS